ncbi:hemagglutinin repeat-containing protein [Achromobacter xylosoxidans]|uniref:hemagglutinin repeat-containing protein n=1 Tax=Alcaligenes xylosoxydans xylosoxydans TaxID=85698 RepID=UPI001F130198
MDDRCATTRLTGVNAYDAIQADPRAAGGLDISIDLGSSKSQSTTKRESGSVRGSSVAAGGDLTVIVQGGGQASNVTVTGSSLSAGNNAAIKADGDIALRAAQNTFEQHSTNKSINASIGVGVTVGSQGVGFTLNFAASAARQGRWQGHQLDQQHGDGGQGAWPAVWRQHALELILIYRRKL